MSLSTTSLVRLSRRTILRATGGGVAAAAVARVDARSARADTAKPADPLFRALDEKIEAAMARYHVPGVAVGVLHDGREYVRGYGVTNVDYPLPVDGDTLFRIGSTTKTFTGTAVMRLVEAGKLDLNALVRRYLPELRLADESVAARVTRCASFSTTVPGGWVTTMRTSGGARMRSQNTSLACVNFRSSRRWARCLPTTTRRWTWQGASSR
jgi:CubicO group peptidase (beta-lactamase class C family)